MHAETAIAARVAEIKRKACATLVGVSELKLLAATSVVLYRTLASRRARACFSPPPAADVPAVRGRTPLLPR